MNPQRLVAAVAALAIGFGVTLVGVGFDDEDTAPDASGSEREVDDFDNEDEEEFDEEEREDDRAEQQEEIAEEAEPAEVEPATTEPTQPPAQQGDTPPEPTSAPAPVQATCELAVIVVGVDERVVVLDSEDVRFGSDERGFDTAVLRVSGEPIDSYVDVVANSLVVQGFFEDTSAGPLFVDCGSGNPITETDPEALRNDLLDAAESEFIVFEVALDFPCDSNFIDEFADRASLSGQLDAARNSGASDADIISFFIALRIAAISQENGRGQDDIEFWQDRLEEPFLGFRVDDNVGDACELLDDSVELEDDTRAGFFCAVGQLASDDELLRFLQSQGLIAPGCGYPSTSEPGADGGFDVPGNDQEEN